MSVRIQNALLTGIVGLMIGSVPTVALAGGGGMMTDIQRDTIGVVRNAGWFLKSSTDPTCAGATFQIFVFGDPTDTPLVMDLTGDGLDQATVFRDSAGFGSFFVRDDNGAAGAGTTQIDFGAQGDLPLIGNFDPTDESEEVAVYRPSTNVFFINGDAGVVEFGMGTTGDLPVAGDFDDDGTDEVGLFRPSTNEFFFRDANTGAGTISTRVLGTSGDEGLVGDWDADGAATPGVRRDLGFGFFFLNNMASGTDVDVMFGLGDATDGVVVGDFDGPTVDEDGCNVMN